jgi:hypothetical protein
MCEIHHEYTENDTFEGYKVVVTDKHGHHYSPYTGIRYIPGPVPKFKKMKKYVTQRCIADQLLGGYGSYNKHHADGNYTGVFIDRKSAVEEARDIVAIFEIPRNCSRNIIKMQISGNLHYGSFVGTPVILGNHIDAVKIVKNTKAER